MDIKPVINPNMDKISATLFAVYEGRAILFTHTWPMDPARLGKGDKDYLDERLEDFMDDCCAKFLHDYGLNAYQAITAMPEYKRLDSKSERAYFEEMKAQTFKGNT